jgi:hypothetical protein
MISFEWCPNGPECENKNPWPDAKRAMGMTVALESMQELNTMDARTYVERVITDSVNVGYVTDQHGVKRHTPADAHYVIHEKQPLPHTYDTGTTHGWTAHYAGHIPPDELIEAQAEFGKRSISTVRFLET